MQRELRLTEDGSHTMYVPELNENYHSINGAFTESKHIFIDAAFNFCKKKDLRVLDIGFGTGLNALLTCVEGSRKNRAVYYHAIEKYPLSMDEVRLLNYNTLLDDFGVSILEIHNTPWEETCQIFPGFFLHKERSDIRKIKAEGLFDVIYFDAFSPDIQAKLWSPEVFKKIATLTAPGGILTSYSVKGDVKRALLAAGFIVEKIPGPYGKRVILRAIK